MHMIDWNTYREQVVAGVGGFAKLSPETVRGYAAMGTGQKTGQLDAKTRELIAIAVAITLRCDGGITVHTDAARKLGRNEGGGRGGPGRRCQCQRWCRYRVRPECWMPMPLRMKPDPLYSPRGRGWDSAKMPSPQTCAR
jgi:AhpD family alkylhydroperoxidase